MQHSWAARIDNVWTRTVVNARLQCDDTGRPSAIILRAQLFCCCCVTLTDIVGDPPSLQHNRCVATGLGIMFFVSGSAPVVLLFFSRPLLLSLLQFENRH